MPIVNEEPVRLSLGEKLGLFRFIASLLLRLPFFCLGALLRNRQTCRSWLHEFRNRATHCLMMHLSHRQVRSICGLTSPVFSQYATKHQLPYEVEEVPDGNGAILHWIGKGSSRKVILYVHGGGFGLPAMPGHIAFLAECRAKLADAGSDVSVALLEYGLTPKHKFPTVYVQTLSSLKHVIKQGYNPSDIVIGGDSAGGNVVLAVLSFQNHPHESVQKLSLEAPLGGFLAISPWCSSTFNTHSWTENRDYDTVTAPTLTSWKEDFISPSQVTEHSEPISALASWWKGVPVRRGLLLAGNKEVFRDEVVAVGKNMKEAGVDAKTVVCAKQIHIECIWDAQMGTEPGDMSYAIWNWLQNVFA